jgi:hypothetical protein
LKMSVNISMDDYILDNKIRLISMTSSFYYKDFV